MSGFVLLLGSYRLYFCLCCSKGKNSVQAFFFICSFDSFDDTSICRRTFVYFAAWKAGVYNLSAAWAECFSLWFLGSFDCTEPLFFSNGLFNLPAVAFGNKS